MTLTGTSDRDAETVFAHANGERGSFGINRLGDVMDRVGPGLELPRHGGS